jgi:hypothetical protein
LQIGLKYIERYVFSALERILRNSAKCGAFIDIGNLILYNISGVVEVKRICVTCLENGLDDRRELYEYI